MPQFSHTRLKILLIIVLFMLIVSTVFAQEETPEITPEPEVTQAVEVTPEIIATPDDGIPDFPEPGSYTASDTMGDVPREYRFYIPEIYPEMTEPAPIVFAFHGAGDSAENIESYSGFNELADREGFIVVYPQGINNLWNDGRPDPTVSIVQDIAFVETMIDFFDNNLNVDTNRVYASGLSMGGMFSFRLGCELQTRIAAIASVGSPLPNYLLSGCDMANPMSVLIIHGTEDPIVYWIGTRGAYLSALNSLVYWREHNNCTDQTPEILVLPDNDPEDNTRVLSETYTECDNNTEVALYGIYGGGHTWAGADRTFPPNVVGLTSYDIEASEVIWEFFQGHSLEDFAN